MPKRLKITVTGAAGQIGYALLPRIASGQMFGNDCEIELQLLELESSLPALEGVAMELNDCAFPLLKKIICTADLKTAMDGTHWGLLVGSVPRKLGMERSDLLQINGGIFTKQGQAINQYAATDVRVFVIGNPCNTNCLIAQHHAPDVPKENFYAMTALDELRARAQIATKAKVAVDAVKKMSIWGNHSSTQVPDFYQAKINGQAVTDIIDESWLKETLVPTVQQRGAAVLKARGASSAASAANAIIYGVNQLMHDTSDDDFYSMACYSNGEYAVDKGLIFSFPCRTINQKLTVVEGLSLNAYTKERFNQTLAELQQEREIIQSLGLL